MSPDQFQLLKAQAPFLTAKDFPDTEVCNGMGMTGTLEALSECGLFRVEASLSKNNPDSSNDELRSECSLDVKVATSEGETLYEFTGMTYEYHGDDPGDHLDDLLRQDEGGLLHMLFDEVFATGTL